MAASPADEPAPWEPVITCPDPMTAEEREACLEHDLVDDLDPDELQYEDDFLNPDADLTEAELAEIAAAMRERAAVAPGATARAAGAAGADPAGIAAVLAAQAAAASVHRRGPGQLGSARPLARESSSAAAGDDYKLKQHSRWTVDQFPDGTFRWTTPSGRQYTTEPTRYPI